MSGCIWWAAWTSYGGPPGRLKVTPGHLTVLGMGLRRRAYAEADGDTCSLCALRRFTRAGP